MNNFTATGFARREPEVRLMNGKRSVEQQETERLVAELLDEKPPENWRELAKGALTGDSA